MLPQPLMSSPLTPSSDRALRIALYSHDTVGLGHTRRNLLIAQALTQAYPNATVLMLTGAATSSQFTAPPRVDFLTLPSMTKGEGGAYEAKSLELSLKQLVKLRSRAIWSSLKAFKPDVFVVDNVPKGAVGELERSLKKLRKKGRTKVVLGLRDILDAPKAVRREWSKAENEAVIAAFYDEVWVYGDPRVCDHAREYGFSAETEAKLRYLGYFDGRARLGCVGHLEAPPEAAEGAPKTVLCQVGGGQDGAALALAFARAALPEGTRGVLVTGPYMPEEVRAELETLASQKPGLEVHAFVAEPTELLRRADRVIAMGGYNTTTEVLAYGKPLLMVPRVWPRREQLERAERFAALGLLDYLHPDHLAPELLSRWLARDVRHASALDELDFGAMAHLSVALADLLLDEVIPPYRWLPEARHVAA